MPSQAVILTIFGITGDLARKKLIPAVFEVFNSNQITNFHLVGFGRRDFTDQDYTNLIQEALADQDTKKVADFLQHTSYFKGLFEPTASFQALAERMNEIETTLPEPALRLFYYAIAPEFYLPVSQLLAQEHLNTDNTRILLEKPFGHDIVSAQELDTALQGIFKEEQLYRVDHYLAKAAVQTLLQWRQEHPELLPIWNDQTFKQVDVIITEDEGIGSRAGYYDQTGAVRDIIQNHGLQLLALTLMPLSDNLREQRAKTIASLTSTDWKTSQYDGYLAEPGVKPHSTTETAATVMFKSSHPDWQDTQISVTTGKKLPEKRIEVNCTFADSVQDFMGYKHPQQLVFRIYPDPAIELLTPEETILLQKLSTTHINDYAAVLWAATQGDEALFVHQSEIMAQWQAVKPVIDALTP